MSINNTHIIKDPHLGKGLAASQDIPAGSILISINDPFLVLVEKEALGKVCSYCFLETEDLKRCGGCMIPRYCSTTCQKDDWKGVHRDECNVLKAMPGVLPTVVRGAMQILKRGKGSEWRGLEGHVEDLRRSGRWDEISLQARAVVGFLGIREVELEAVVGLLCRMSTNAFRVTLPDDTPVGLCFSPTLAMANHSCSPNAVIIFNGREVSLRSLNPLQKGDQIFITYVDPIQARKMRRGELRDRYFFECECEMCKRDENPYQAFLRRPQGEPGQKWALWWEIDKLTQEAESCISQITPSLLSSQPTTSKIQTLLERSRSTSDPTQRLKILDEIHTHIQPLTTHKLYALPPYPTYLNELYLHHLSTQSYLAALILLLFISQHIDPFTYPQPHHTIRITHLFTLAKLMKYVASIPTSALFLEDMKLDEDQRHTVRNVDYVSAVQGILVLVREEGAKCFGGESMFLKEVKEEMRDVESVQGQRGNVGLELRRWVVQGSVAVEGKLLAETLFGGLRNVAGMVGVVVKGLKV